MSRHLVHPELLPFLDMMPARPPMDRDNLAERRAFVFPRPPLTPEQESVRRSERMIPGPEGAPDVRVLVYEPAEPGTAPRPGYVHMHGGGFVLGTPDMSDGSNRNTVLKFGCTIVSVDYRLAPENPAPAGLEDCYAALAWLHKEAASLGVDPKRIAVGGESAGGGLAANLAILARDRGEYPVCFQSLDCPMLDDRTCLNADPHPYVGDYVWDLANNAFGWGALLGVDAGFGQVPDYAVAARCEDLSGLPPAFIAVGTLDLFVEEDMDYARRLIRAGVPTELHLITGAYHGFNASGADTAPTRQHTYLRTGFMAKGWGVDA
jgi:triacylglycerol lipase